MYLPTSKNVLVKVKIEDEETKFGFVIRDSKTLKEKEAMNYGEVLEVGKDVTEVKKGDIIAFREATYWKNKERINPDEVEVGLYIIQERDILLIIENTMDEEKTSLTEETTPVSETSSEPQPEVVTEEVEQQPENVEQEQLSEKLE